MQFKKKLLGAGIALALGVAGTASATTGYAPHGIGMKSKGMGGVGIAMAEDAVAGGMNPANMAWLGTRIDVGVDLFRPIRKAESTGHAFLPAGQYDGSHRKLFAIPEFGANLVVDDSMTMGISVFGNGGMNTDYGTNLGGFGTRRTGIDMMQLFVVPNVSYKITENQAVGIGINLVAQALEVSGIDNFGTFGFSSDPTKLSDNGHDLSYGAGLRVGWSGRPMKGLQLAATYQTRTYMTKFDDYAGMLAEQGDFDVPSNWGLGVAFEVTPDLTVAFDFMHINYSEVASVGNIGQAGLAPGSLGTDDGPGFDWRDQNVYKLGVSYKVNRDLLVRAGFAYATQVIRERETLFNTLAPATVKKHLTLGATYTLASGNEVTVTYMHAFNEKVKGTGLSAGVDIEMYQDSLGVAYSWKF